MRAAHANLQPTGLCSKEAVLALWSEENIALHANSAAATLGNRARATARSMVFAVAMAVSVAIFVLPAFR